MTTQQAADVARYREIAEQVVNTWTARRGQPDLGHLVDDIQDALAAAEERGRLRERADIETEIDRQVERHKFFYTSGIELAQDIISAIEARSAPQPVAPQGGTDGN